jgi:hypothetical protein
MPIPLLAAYLWDLRSLCENQVRALTDAQRQLDVLRDGKDPDESEAALKRLRADLDRVLAANRAVREAVQDAVSQARKFTASPAEPHS